MPAYAYAIPINRNKEIIVENIFHTLDDEMMTLEDMKELVGDNKFSIQAGCEENVIEQSVVLCIRTEREETDAEYASRIRKQEAYMAEYKRRQKLKIS